MNESLSVECSNICPANSPYYCENQDRKDIKKLFKIVKYK